MRVQVQVILSIHAREFVELDIAYLEKDVVEGFHGMDVPVRVLNSLLREEEAASLQSSRESRRLTPGNSGS